jgi:hypothetical protein
VDTPAQSPLSGRGRAGVALFAALAILALVALLAGGALASFRLASRSSRFANTDAVLTAAADFAVTSVAMNAVQFGLDTLPLGVARNVAPIPPSTNSVTPTVVATRLAGGVVWLVADATQGGIAGGHRRINLVMRWRSPGQLPPSALVARGDVRLAAGATFSVDTTGDADCRAVPSADVTVPAGAVVTQVSGTSVSSAPTAADSTTYMLTSSQIAQLTGPGVTHVAGDTTIAGGVFQGILIVDGVLTIAGPYTVTGLIVARRSIVATSGTLVVTGAMLSFALSQTSVPAIDLGPSNIRYSRCAIAAAIRRAVPLRPVRERSWAELF